MDERTKACWLSVRGEFTPNGSYLLVSTKESDCCSIRGKLIQVNGAIAYTTLKVLLLATQKYFWSLSWLYHRHSDLLVIEHALLHASIEVCWNPMYKSFIPESNCFFNGSKISVENSINSSSIIQAILHYIPYKSNSSNNFFISSPTKTIIIKIHND